jgi:hypothetical protein
VWLSLVERYVRDVEAAGSNPVTSTIEETQCICTGLFVCVNFEGLDENQLSRWVRIALGFLWLYCASAEGEKGVARPNPVTSTIEEAQCICTGLFVCVNFEGLDENQLSWWVRIALGFLQLYCASAEGEKGVARPNPVTSTIEEAQCICTGLLVCVNFE